MTAVIDEGKMISVLVELFDCLFVKLLYQINQLNAIQDVV